MSERIEAPVRLMEALQKVQEQIERLSAQLHAAMFGARVSLGVPDDWGWDGVAWVAPKKEEEEKGRE